MQICDFSGMCPNRQEASPSVCDCGAEFMPIWSVAVVCIQKFVQPESKRKHKADLKGRGGVSGASACPKVLFMYFMC